MVEENGYILIYSGYLINEILYAHCSCKVEGAKSNTLFKSNTYKCPRPHHQHSTTLNCSPWKTSAKPTE